MPFLHDKAERVAVKSLCQEKLELAIWSMSNQSCSANMELQEPFVLPPFFWTESSAGQHQDEWVAFLQLRERAVLPTVVRKVSSPERRRPERCLIA
jgi:hypothetical protein